MPASAPGLGRAGPVEEAAFSPDGRRVLLAAGDTARAYDALTGEPVSPAVRHAAALRSAAFSPDGRHFLTVTTRYRLGVWDAATAEEVTPSTANEDPDSTEENPKRREVLGFLRRGRAPDRGADHAGVYVWDMPAGEPHMPCAGPRHRLRCVQPRRAPFRGRPGRNRGVRDAATGEAVSREMHSPTSVVGLAFHPDGRHLLVWTEGRSGGAGTPRPASRRRRPWPTTEP